MCSMKFGANLELGTYQIKPLSRLIGADEWLENNGSDKLYLEAVVEEKQITFNAVMPEETIELDENGNEKEKEEPAPLVTFTAKNYTREYGEENPVLGYSMSGGTVEGKPDASCSATPQSPVGVYPIVISEVTDEAYIGSVVAADGYVYATLDDVDNASKTAVAKICYVGSETGDATYNHGLALALFDVSEIKSWCSTSNNCLGSQYTTVAEAKGDLATFSRACATASASMSMPTTSAAGKRCAIMSAMSAVPVPMSRIRGPPCAHAPSSVPSVPTFMAHRSCQTQNWRNWK